MGNTNALAGVRVLAVAVGHDFSAEAVDGLSALGANVARPRLDLASRDTLSASIDAANIHAKTKP